MIGGFWVIGRVPKESALCIGQRCVSIMESLRYSCGRSGVVARMLYFLDLMSLLTTAGRKVRSLREFARGLTDTAHPLLVQIIPIRRCNIDCGYCNEYDKVSPPIPFDVLQRRIDRLADLGTSV